MSEETIKRMAKAIGRVECDAGTAEHMARVIFAGLKAYGVPVEEQAQKDREPTTRETISVAEQLGEPAVSIARLPDAPPLLLEIKSGGDLPPPPPADLPPPPPPSEDDGHIAPELRAPAIEEGPAGINLDK